MENEGWCNMFMMTKQFMDSSDSVYYFLNTFPVVYVMNYIEDGKIKRANLFPKEQSCRRFEIEASSSS